jgi:biopolymer transport protein ExbB/TolQ
MISLSDLVFTPLTLAAAEASFFMKIVENSIWIGLGLCAALGMYCGILLLRRVKQKRFPGAAAEEAFLSDFGECLDKQDFDGAAAVCDNPAVWSRALPQLALLAIQNRTEPMKKIRQIVGERFERDILASLEVLNSWVGTSIKTGPQLGLLGTVLGMINAFAKIAGAAASGVDPKELSKDISFALWTTAAGMAISIPLIVLQGAASNSIKRLQESIDEGTGLLLDDFAAAKARSGS